MLLALAADTGIMIPRHASIVFQSCELCTASCDNTAADEDDALRRILLTAQGNKSCAISALEIIEDETFVLPRIFAALDSSAKGER